MERLEISGIEKGVSVFFKASEGVSSEVMSSLGKEEGAYASYLTPLEVSYASRYTHEPSRQNHLRTRVAAKEAIISLLPSFKDEAGDVECRDNGIEGGNSQFQAFEILNDDLGAPYIKSSLIKSNIHGLNGWGLSLSLSHLDEGSLIAISNNRDSSVSIGCDLCLVSQKTRVVIERFSKSRQLSLFSYPGLTPDDLTALQWSVWEACSKVNKRGFRDGFNDYEVTGIQPLSQSCLRITTQKESLSVVSQKIRPNLWATIAYG